MPCTDTNPRSSTRKEEDDDDEEQGTSRETNSNSHCSRKMKGMNRGAWTAEEDMKLAQVIEIYGPQKWKSVASKAGLSRCGKSCRLRWLNYLRPNIKRGNISYQEEDLILRLHKLLGNRWSLIAGRLPGRTDNEIKNYWNSHLSKKLKQGGSRDSRGKPDADGEGKKCSDNEHEERVDEVKNRRKDKEESSKGCSSSSFCEELLSGEMNFNVDDFFDFSNENQSNLEWLGKFLQLDGEISCQFS